MIFVEGGGDKEACRKAVRTVLEKGGLTGRVPRIVACGSRNEAFDDFKHAQEQQAFEDVFLIVDSEDPVADRNQPWAHLASRDKWQRPSGASDEQVFLMTTCMETWIAADHTALKAHYGARLHDKSLPPLFDLEQRDRHEVQDNLVAATRNCKNVYRKGARSFHVLLAVNPQTLSKLLPAFARMLAILEERLPVPR
jgi:hypothetical protein